MLTMAAFEADDLASARDAVKAYARVLVSDEDALIEGLAATALLLCEAFCGRIGIAREGVELAAVGLDWTRLGASPVRAVTSVQGMHADGEAYALPVEAYAIDIDAEGCGWVRMTSPGAAARLRVLAGANLAVLGDELIQFGRAEPLGGARWRLSRLARGRRGTGWAAGTHAIGERFVLIEEEALAVYDPPLSAAGGTVRLMASGIGDAVPAEALAAGIGAALRPLAPVHLTARTRDDGRFDLSWIRASRAGWAWLDGADAPLAEDREAYRLTIVPGTGPSRAHELDAPAFIYDPAGDAGAGSVTFSVVQAGTRAVSRPALLTLSL